MPYRYLWINKLTDAADDTIERLRLDGGGNRGWGQRRVEGKEVSSETGDVWGGLGSSGQCHDSAVVPGRDDEEP